MDAQLIEDNITVSQHWWWRQLTLAAHLNNFLKSPLVSSQMSASSKVSDAPLFGLTTIKYKIWFSIDSLRCN